MGWLGSANNERGTCNSLNWVTSIAEFAAAAFCSPHNYIAVFPMLTRKYLRFSHKHNGSKALPLTREALTSCQGRVYTSGPTFLYA